MTATAGQDQRTIIAVLGTGKMGAAVARRCADNGAEVRVWNRSHERAESLRSDRITPHPRMADAVARADAVLTLLSDETAVLETVAALAPDLDPHTVLIEASTVAPDCTHRVARLVTAPVLAAAVSGTPAVVHAGAATVIVSGDEATKSRARSALDLFAAGVVDVGPGQADAKLVKLGINSVLAGTMQLLAEAVLMVEAGGIDRAIFAAAMGQSVLASRYTGYKLDALASRDYEPTFTSADLRKDVRLALRQAAAADLDLPVARQVERQLDQVVALGWGEQDFLALLPALQVASRQPTDLAPRTGADT